ncbi:hypothetical protein RND71_012462 [Anisodus tanguticus]|uniref:Bulb-type lectin domain-containing protein n=1 Tax=Anisodus tanguticus TaxID=243964 RepID=A0AAE1SEN9_9SOLA|nr:hypothetical protein RND71_012462 [Anisodus tanguticus]
MNKGNAGPRFLCGFYYKYNATECFLSILLYHNRSGGEKGVINKPELVWSASRNHPVKANATLQLGQDGNLVLSDSDGTLVWSTDTTGKSSFDHPTDSLLPGQNLISGRSLIASVSATNWSQGLLSLTVLNGRWVTYTDTDPPQYYYASTYSDSSYYSFDGQTFTALQFPTTPTAQFMIGPDGHLKVYQWAVIDWNEVSDLVMPYVGNCGYPMVFGR